MEDIIVALVLQALEAALTKAIETGITYIIKKTIDAAGNMITEIVYEFDSDGDGKNDSEQVIYTLLIPLYLTLKTVTACAIKVMK